NRETADVNGPGLARLVRHIEDRSLPSVVLTAGEKRRQNSTGRRQRYQTDGYTADGTTQRSLRLGGQVQTSTARLQQAEHGESPLLCDFDSGLHALASVAGRGATPERPLQNSLPSAAGGDKKSA